MMVPAYEGTKSGKAYSFPVGYAEDEQGLVTFTRSLVAELPGREAGVR